MAPHTQADAFYDPNAIFHDDGPIDPMFTADAVQALVRALPLDTTEPVATQRRRVNSALTALAATNARDPIEVMLAVQAIAAYHAACACWRIGMNVRHPRGDSTRHVGAAATAARTFDSLLRAIERRQAKPLAVPAGRPAPRVWARNPGHTYLDVVAQRIQLDDETPVHEPLRRPPNPPSWTPEALKMVRRTREREHLEQENAGLDLDAVEGILPGGSIIMPECPTPAQERYIARRLYLMYRREHAENLRRGIKIYPKIRPLRAGDLIP